MTERHGKRNHPTGWLIVAGAVILAAALTLGWRLQAAVRTAGAEVASVAEESAAQAGVGTGAPARASGEGAPAGKVDSVALTPTATADDELNNARVRVDEDAVVFHFAAGKAELAAGASDALGDIVKGVAAGKMAVISGNHDVANGTVEERELAAARVRAVRDALLALGIGEDKIVVRQPEGAAPAGDDGDAESRRVEVTLED